MAINKYEIDKYIFDPKNPKQCLSYNLLLKIAKKENYTFFSPEFLQYFFTDQIITKELEDSLWDKPKNYYELNVTEKLDLYIQNYSEQELQEYIKNINLEKSFFFRIDFIKKY